MGTEIDLLANYPRAQRNIKERGETKTEADRTLARRFGKDFFDGERRHGYGGFQYSPRFWQPVVPAFQKYFGLQKGHKILDIGCAKGFMLYDFMQLIPGIQVTGIDISSYAIENAIDPVKPYLTVGDACSLPYPSRFFDLVISINTIHNLEKEELVTSLREMERVSKGGCFITVDAYRNDAEKEAMNAWNLTAKTVLHVDEWKQLFKTIGYNGDYYWFMP
jgi:SAM-dependent methyltransferase